MKCEIRIMGVVERRNHIKRLQHLLGIADDKVFIDINRAGCMANAMRAWGASADEDITHIMVLQDDIDVSENFLESINTMIEVHPNAIFGLCDRCLVFKDKKIDSPYVKMQRCDVSGQAIIIPKKYINGFLTFCRKELKNYVHDDGAIMMYAVLNDIDVFSTIPNIVQHIEPTNSVINRVHNSETKISKCFDKKGIPQSELQKKAYNISKKYKIDTGLRPDHPVQIKVLQKLKEREEWKQSQ